MTMLWEAIISVKVHTAVVAAFGNFNNPCVVNNHIDRDLVRLFTFDEAVVLCRVSSFAGDILRRKRQDVLGGKVDLLG